MTIPNDVLTHAEEVAAEWEMEPGAHRMLVAAVASAIMWGRKRCAGVCREATNSTIGEAYAKVIEEG